jgi:hypothetical protein
MCVYINVFLFNYYFNTQLSHTYITTFIYCYSYICTCVYFYLLFETINNKYFIYVLIYLTCQLLESYMIMDRINGIDQPTMSIDLS